MMLRDSLPSLLNRLIGTERIKFPLLVCCISLVGTAAIAQTRSEPTKPDQRNTQPESAASDGVPAGGCMPIGLTARGDLVFPLQCRELIERERGPISEEQTRAAQQKLEMPATRQKGVSTPEQPRERVHKNKQSRDARQKQTTPMPIAPQDGDPDAATTGRNESKSLPGDGR